ncbi:type II secretion protein [uncultured Photobacterium sp.]|uniref:type II secretion protein n=1 Tax=uncultured Photobacterium sp. TaxID=173973 RepID=UPI002604AA44|nr:type II secretion protein [uncultured Photobacterium sp.]
MDLDNLFKSSTNRESSKAEIVDLIVSEDKAFVDSVKELYAIEGFHEPIHMKNIHNEDELNEIKQKIRNVILDFRSVNDIVADVNDIATQLDVDINIITVSNLDSIKVKNQVLALGANYVLLDEELNELLAAILSLNGSKEQTAHKKTRIAKRVLFLGSKGGIGLSAITSLLAHTLSEGANLKTLLVDHDSGALNSDMFLAIKGLKVRQTSSDITERDIDSAIARTYTNKAREKLDYLMLEKHGEGFSLHSQTLYNLSQQLVDEYNFIIDAMPLSSFDQLNGSEMQEKYHRIFVVCEQSVSSLRAYNALKRKLGKTPHQLVFSQTRPAKDYVIPLDNAKVRIKQKDTIDIGYEPGLEKIFVHEGPVGVMNTKFSDPIRTIVASLTGKTIVRKKRFKLFSK